VSGEVLVVLLLLALSLLFYLLFQVRGRQGDRMRSLPGLQELPRLLRRSAETGHPLHVSVGVRGIGGADTAETWAGLGLLAQLADQAAAHRASLLVTVADATVIPVAEEILRHADAARHDLGEVRFIAPDPTAYATGVMGLLEREPLAGSVMVGSFHDEYLLMGETAVRKGVTQVAGAFDPGTLPFLQATSDDPFLGEQAFAAAAHQSKKPAQVGSLIVEDWARWAIIAAILVAAVVKALL